MFTETCWIPEMTTPAAMEKITAALTTAAGVLQVRPNLPDRRLVLTYESPASPERLREVIEGSGFAVASGLTPLSPPE